MNEIKLRANPCTDEDNVNLKQFRSNAMTFRRIIERTKSWELHFYMQFICNVDKFFEHIFL